MTSTTFHAINGTPYRVSVYRSGAGYSSFAETAAGPPRYLGTTGEHRSPATAKLTALCLARQDAAHNSQKDAS